MLPHLLIVLLLASAAAGLRADPLLPSPSTELRSQAAKAVAGRRDAPVMSEAAQQAFAAFDSPQARRDRAARAESLRALLGVEAPRDAADPTNPALSAHRLYVFVSASMPLSALRNYARDLEGVPGATLVLRGCVDGCARLGPSAGFGARVLREDTDCEGPRCPMRRTALAIDPLLFRRYGVERVPTVVLAEGVDAPGHCSEGNEGETRVADWHVVRGDASLPFVLQSLLNAGVAGAGDFLEAMQPPGEAR